MTEGTGFAAIPRHLFGTLTAHELVVYAVLAYHADATGLCWPSHATIAREGGLGVTSVKKALGGLRDKGHITWTPRSSGDGGVVANDYRVVAWRRGGSRVAATNKNHRTRASEQGSVSSSSLRSSSSTSLCPTCNHDERFCDCGPA